MEIPNENKWHEPKKANECFSNDTAPKFLVWIEDVAQKLRLVPVDDVHAHLILGQRRVGVVRHQVGQHGLRRSPLRSPLDVLLVVRHSLLLRRQAQLRRLGDRLVDGDDRVPAIAQRILLLVKKLVGYLIWKKKLKLKSRAC